VEREEIRRRVGDALAQVELTGLERRKPSQLSGGQQQRVALARVLVLKPAVVLLDEPLGALDAKIRRALQVELKALQQQVGLTFIYVTHDQEEALTMSDRLAVMNLGRIEQLGPPKEVYEEPETAFVADFLGISNILRGVAAQAGQLVELGEFELHLPRRTRDQRSGEVKLFIRPERVRLHPRNGAEPNEVPAMVERVVYGGASSQVYVRLADGQQVQALVQNADEREQYASGDPVQVRLPPEALRLLAETGSSSGAETVPSEIQEEAGAAINH
jgi:spermidine/putrescine transport system ATP-binding protein